VIAWKPSPFIFVHIPRCGGTSIESALIPAVTGYKGFNGLSEEVRSRFWLPGKQQLQHSKLRRFERHFKLNEYFKFTFVRNPWDRAVSQIEYLRSAARSPLFSGSSFKENLKIYCNTKRKIWAHDLGACQLDYLRNHVGELDLDFVGKFESLLNDYRKICTVIGIETIPDLPHVLNTKRTGHYSSYYDAESAGWIKKRFAKDIDFFGYKFENL